MKLTRLQRRALEEIRDAGKASAYQLAFPSQVFGRLMRAGCIEQVRQVITWDKFSMFRITPAGRAALEESSVE